MSNSSPPIRTVKAAAFFNTSIGFSFNGLLISGEAEIITLSIANCRLPICRHSKLIKIGNWQSEIGNGLIFQTSRLDVRKGRPKRSSPACKDRARAGPSRDHIPTVYNHQRETLR